MTILSVIATLSVFAQSKTQIAIMSNARLLDRTVFGSKDSVTLDKLFAPEIAYVHSSGKVENRAEAIHGIIHNKSTYEVLPETSGYKIDVAGDSATVVRIFRATEKKADGSISPLNISIRTVWVETKGKKSGGEWKLIRREATKVE